MWACPPDELTATHEETIKEAERDVMRAAKLSLLLTDLEKLADDCYGLNHQGSQHADEIRALLEKYRG